MTLYPDPKLLSLLKLAGWSIAGDLGPWTLYTTRRGRLVIYERAPPTQPPTPAQKAQRARFGRAIGQYLDLSSDLKAKWELLAARLSVCMTGLNLYVSLALVPNDPALDTANRQTGLSLPPPEPVP